LGKSDLSKVDFQLANLDSALKSSLALRDCGRLSNERARLHRLLKNSVLYQGTTLVGP
jgi:hypothetical protein